MAKAKVPAAVKAPVVKKNVQNPGSTLGEAIGAAIEKEVNRVLKPIAEKHGCIYRSTGKQNPKTGKHTKLLLKDSAGNEYNIDSVIANKMNQPLVLVESKYIRYKKHNRDKGSWICTAHYSLRRTYPTVRKSIAIIAGSWSSSSKAMMESFDVVLYEVPFDNIVKVLAGYEIDFAWGEKERDKAMVAWEKWATLKETDYDKIAKTLLAVIEPQLKKDLAITLDESTERSISDAEVIVGTNTGESRRFTFESTDEAAAFLAEMEVEKILDTTDGPVLWKIEESKPVKADPCDEMFGDEDSDDDDESDE